MKKEVSLAYRNLRSIPEELARRYGSEGTRGKKEVLTLLDLTENQITDPAGLGEFQGLETLILDHNKLTAHSKVPVLRALTTLSVNKNEIKNLAIFADRLAHSVPQLRILSMLQNEACPNYFNGGTRQQYDDYRVYLVGRLPLLLSLDGQRVSEEERSRGKQLYSPSIQRSLTIDIEARPSAPPPSVSGSLPRSKPPSAKKSSRSKSSFSSTPSSSIPSSSSVHPPPASSSSTSTIASANLSSEIDTGIDPLNATEIASSEADGFNPQQLLSVKLRKASDRPSSSSASRPSAKVTTPTQRLNSPSSSSSSSSSLVPKSLLQTLPSPKGSNVSLLSPGLMDSLPSPDLEATSTEAPPVSLSLQGLPEIDAFTDDDEWTLSDQDDDSEQQQQEHEQEQGPQAPTVSLMVARRSAPEPDSEGEQNDSDWD